ncbi:hypothetical protein RB16p004 [Escherichia phage RB16]|uniref:SprT-like domain-containing protein n=1 Tax=Escherichia phage RB16 TaxID=2681599 RepID=D9IC65_BPRB1|nr:hypothetical protein RB16p004 [Escherichia phage RB16]ADJ55308.1 conserved hypothetical protein [Escherichia phage RB16]
MFKTRSDMEITIWAKSIMAKHGLSHWSFKINGRFKRTLGCCSYSKREIQLRRKHVEEDTYDCILDTLMHEIAHALVGYGAGHGPVWQRKAIELGAKPTSSKVRVREKEIIEKKDDHVYAMFLKTSNGEVYQSTMPEKMYNEIQSGKRNISTMYMVGHKASTKGRLVARKLTSQEFAKVLQ